MANKSMTDIAFDLLSTKKTAVDFASLWGDVSAIGHYSMDSIGQFYSDLSLDSRFASLADNKWDLKTRRTFQESHIDLSSIELDEDESESDNDGSEDEESTESSEEEYE